MTAYGNHGGGTEWSNIGGTHAVLGRLTTNFTTPAGSAVAGTRPARTATPTPTATGCPTGPTNTGVFVNEGSTGTNPNVADTDGDGMKDGDETLGTLSGLNLPQMGAKPTHKDLAMEFDWFDDNAEPGNCAAHSHRPTPAIISAVSAAYANSPMPNPDGTTGVHLIADYGQGAPFSGGNLVSDADGNINVTFDASGLGFGGAEFLNIKSANFAANRNGYFHYVLLPHRYNNGASSGVAELPGDDTIVRSTARLHQQRGQHDHARDGPQPEPAPRRHRRRTNYKPNYNSVMNYLFQFPGIDTTATPRRRRPRLLAGHPHLAERELAQTSRGRVRLDPIDWNGNGILDARPVDQHQPELRRGEGDLTDKRLGHPRRGSPTSTVPGCPPHGRGRASRCPTGRKCFGGCP